MNIDPEILRDMGYRGALHILTSRVFRDNDARLWPHVKLTTPDGSEIRFDKILAQQGWSHTEDLMLRAAWSIFNQDCYVNLWNLVNRLSDYQARVLIDAIACAAFRNFIPRDGLLHQRAQTSEG